MKYLESELVKFNAQGHCTPKETPFRNSKSGVAHLKYLSLWDLQFESTPATVLLSGLSPYSSATKVV